jgi:6-phosphogluconate dehydrogenase
MKIGYIGLGKMGMGMVQNLLEHGHEVVVANRSKEPVDVAVEYGATGAYSYTELIEQLESPRTIWLMVPWQAVDEVIAEILPQLAPGDTIIDGGNSPYVETVRRAREITGAGIQFMDIGVSGGPAGARSGACMMVGGDDADFKKYEALIRDCCIPNGYGYMGGHGAGHFVKMVHNGIEYGMMQAIGEGFEVMKQAPEFSINLTEVARVYNTGSVIESRLVGWLHKAFIEEGEDLDAISGSVKHSGEGLWTVEAAKRNGVPVPIIEGSLAFREESTGNPSYTGQVVSALRNQFGGHEVKKK